MRAFSEATASAQNTVKIQIDFVVSPASLVDGLIITILPVFAGVAVELYQLSLNWTVVGPLSQSDGSDCLELGD